jgi:Arc/MetJ family transcription regulator
MILLISAAQVARITGVSHQHPAIHAVLRVITSQLADKLVTKL